MAFSILLFTANAQVSAPSPDSTGKIYNIIETMPQFPGGEEKLLKFIAQKIKYPREARRKNITGRVIANFYIDKLGKACNVKIIKGIGGGCDEELIRVLNLMPNWTPGKQDGVPVNVNYNLPVNFSLK